MLTLLAGVLLAVLPQSAPSAQSAQSNRAELRAALQAHLDELVADGRPPGISAGLVLSDGSELALAAGLADRAAKTPLAPTDRLCAGSTGKTFVAATVLQLVQARELALDAFASDFLGEEPWFARLPNADELTVERLLRHRTGLERYEFQPEFARDLVAQPERVWKPAELLSYACDKKPLFPAGEGFAYSDTNYIVLGLIVERVTGKPLYDEVRRRFLAPLALATVAPQDGRTIAGLVHGYAGASDPLGLPDEVIGADGRFVINPQFEWAGGGFVTTGGDLARWARALYGGDVLGAETRALMLAGTDAPELGRGMRYGLGVELWPSGAVGHSGFFPGYLTEMRWWAEPGMAVAVQVNTSDARAVGKSLGRLCEELRDVALQHAAAAAPAGAPR